MCRLWVVCGGNLLMSYEYSNGLTWNSASIVGQMCLICCAMQM